MEYNNWFVHTCVNSFGFRMSTNGINNNQLCVFNIYVHIVYKITSMNYCKSIISLQVRPSLPVIFYNRNEPCLRIKLFFKKSLNYSFPSKHLQTCDGRNFTDKDLFSYYVILYTTRELNEYSCDLVEVHRVAGTKEIIIVLCEILQCSCKICLQRSSVFNNFVIYGGLNFVHTLAHILITCKRIT